ncbi:hypothetical protein NPIL_415511 [Nephila pilipes]|uniref:Uncharacterized protein n=1 Tax=Nephila pilipes TaxID=299642 RepID=A0A8X6IA06_NEPPI|nr:hypothetical protein NPIL_415511 [Nephila pilipes]
MKGKAPTDLLLPILGHTIPDLKKSGHTIPDLKRPDHGISKSTLVTSPLLGDVSFPRLGKKLVPKFFSTTTGWRSLVAVMMGSRSPTASCPTLWISGVSRPCRNVSPTSTLVRSVSPMPDPRCNFGPFKTVYPPCPLGNASPS